MPQGLTYLAIPYSHPDPAVREERFHRVNKAASILMLQGVLIYSPITHSHPIAVSHGLPCGWDFWELHDTAILSACERLMVLMLDGWEESVGVMAEIKIAQELGIEVWYLDPERLIE